MTQPKIRVADYIAQTLAQNGVKHVFMVTGGGAMHLNDAIGRCKELEWIACHHEQACAMAAESYTRMSGRLAAVNVTSGPGGTNAITGVLGAWLDSIGMIVISGQVKWETLVRSTELPLRQLGDQEYDIVKSVAPMTKYAEMVTDPSSIRYHLEKALYLAREGRPGPVWLDIPMNVQGALIDPASLKAFAPPAKSAFKPELEDLAQKTVNALGKAKRPVLLLGGGVRISGMYEETLALIEQMGIPVVTAWNSHDLIWDEHPLYMGRPGTIGDRTGNFVVQNSDFLMVLGCRLNIRQISYNWQAFARDAFKVMVDADAAELKKPTLKIDLPIHASLQEFVPLLQNALKNITFKPFLSTPEGATWAAWGKERKEKYPAVLPEYWKTSRVNPYCFVQSLFDQLEENELVVTGDGTACVVTFQAAKIKKGQRLYTNSGCASMGYDLPAAIGAWHSQRTGGNPPKRLICIAGDGSIQMNIQELQTLVTHKIPAKIFVLNNEGYHSIRQTQANYFPDNIVGCGKESGLGFPDFGKLADAYGIPHFRAENHEELSRTVSQTLQTPGIALAEIVLDLEQQFAPKLASRKLPDGRMVSSPLEDLFPFLSREELKSNMLIPILTEDKQ